MTSIPKPRSGQTPLSVVPLSPVPLYTQIKDMLRERILDGSYQPHQRMPSESGMIASFNVIFLSDKIYVMTARPGRIKAEVPVLLPRPRTPEMTSSTEFIAMVQQLKALIREESLAAMGGELVDGGLGGFGMEVGPEGVAHMV